MDRPLKQYVTERLKTFERDNDAQLRLQESHAQAQGRQLSDAQLPLAFDLSGRKRGLYDMFDVEVALILFGREKPEDSSQ